MATIVHYKEGTFLPVYENWIFEQVKNLTRHEPVVYSLRKENNDLFPVKIIRSLEIKEGVGTIGTFCNKGFNFLFNFYPGFYYSLSKDKPQLIHAHFGPSGYNFLFYKMLFRIPMLTNFYGYDVGQLPYRDSRWLKRYAKLFKYGECFLVEGESMKNSLVELGCPRKKILIQHLGIDLKKIKFSVRKIEENGEIRILVASRFKEKKGIPYALEAFCKVKSSHPELKIKLTIIGDAEENSDGENIKKRILEIIDKYNMEEHITLSGIMTPGRLIKEAEKHHIFISSSVVAKDGDSEGGVPVSIIQMTASGMPVLSTYHCDIPEVIIDGKNGFLVKERDVDALASKLEFLIYNPDKWQDMGKFGRRHVEAEYDIKKQAEKLEKIYDIFIAKHIKK
jgi:colanic acid/amylovoran biosynthesis glycosyltransferase